MILHVPFYLNKVQHAKKKTRTHIRIQYVLVYFFVHLYFFTGLSKLNALSDSEACLSFLDDLNASWCTSFDYLFKMNTMTPFWRSIASSVNKLLGKMMYIHWSHMTLFDPIRQKYSINRATYRHKKVGWNTNSKLKLWVVTASLTLVKRNVFYISPSPGYDPPRRFAPNWAKASRKRLCRKRHRWISKFNVSGPKCFKSSFLYLPKPSHRRGSWAP